MQRKAIGDRAEHLAYLYLKKRGLSLLHRNFRCRGGEIDLIMRDADSLVFVEVRYRSSTDYGRAAETVSARKQDRIIRCAQYYMTRHGLWNTTARFDVVCLEGNAENPRVEWISDAFTADSRRT
jgi:putative endonuclease